MMKMSEGITVRAARRMFVLLPAISLCGCLEVFEAFADPEDEEDCTPTPVLCDRNRPHSADLTIHVSSPLPCQVTVYRGDYEYGKVVWQGAPQGESWSIRLPLGEYSATATYARGTQTIIAVDGDDLDYESSSTCDANCYEEIDGSVDLELVD
jgi:hypothetical protein